MVNAIYLDYNATSPMLPAVIDAMENLREYAFNPSSMHQFGQEARQLLRKARAQVAHCVEADPDHVIFTSSATESNNIALNQKWESVFVSAIDHESVIKVRSDAHIIPVDSQGVVDLEALETLLKTHARGNSLVSVQWANNETGVIQPIEEIVTLAKKYGALVHTDAAQMIGRAPVSFSKVDLMSFGSHKMGGPLGAAALVSKISLEPLFQGGGQEKGNRPGTENISAIVGFGVACQEMPDLSHLRCWHDRLEATLPGYVFSKEVPRIPNTTCIVMPGIPHTTQVMAFDLAGICISAGSACSTGRVTVSRILEAISHNNNLASCAIRVSSGWKTQKEDLEKFEEIWKTIMLEQS